MASDDLKVPTGTPRLDRFDVALGSVVAPWCSPSACSEKNGAALDPGCWNHAPSPAAGARSAASVLSPLALRARARHAVRRCARRHATQSHHVNRPSIVFCRTGAFLFEDLGAGRRRTPTSRARSESTKRRVLPRPFRRCALLFDIVLRARRWHAPRSCQRYAHQPIDCALSDWGDWSGCMVHCKRRRSRRVLVASYRAPACGTTLESTPCTDSDCRSAGAPTKGAAPATPPPTVSVNASSGRAPFVFHQNISGAMLTANPEGPLPT